MIKLAAVAAFLALNSYVYFYLGEDSQSPPRQDFEEFPLAVGDWHCKAPEKMEDHIERRLGVTDYLICLYSRETPAAMVGIYVGYHERQVREGGKLSAESAIHPPKHCLPGSGWNIMSAESVPLDVPGAAGGLTVNRLVIAKGNERQLVYYWYQERGRVIAEDWQKIVYLFWDRATRGRSDGSLVRFTIPIQSDAATAEAAFRDLAGALIPRLPDYVPN